MDMVEFKALKQFSTVGYGNTIIGKTISLPMDIGIQMCDAGLVELPEESKKAESKKVEPEKEKQEPKKSAKK